MIDTRKLERFEPIGYAVLRIVAGFMFALHGLPKLFGWFGQLEAVGSQKWFGGIIELVCGALIMIGLFTRPAAFLASGTMAVAFLQFHWKFEPSLERLLPIVNRGDAAVLYCFLFLLVAIRGAGIWSLDRVRR